ncbi:MAG TPA: amidohydrolase family protein [Nevskiaceae bacterium]|nr:amidohydrolase family protein [Nevskiaceae bacterium]
MTSRKTAFINAQVFDGENPVRSAPSTVVIADGVIERVTPGHAPGEGADIIDCTGRTLMPGLIDAHVHVYANSLKLSPPEAPMSYRAHHAARFLSHILGCGFTAVRDVAGGDQGLAMALRDGYLQGPRYFYGGPALSQTGGHGDMRAPGTEDLCPCCSGSSMVGLIADGVDACRTAVRDQFRKGAHHIKIMASGGVVSPTDPLEYPQYSTDELRAIVDECDRRGSYACAHCHPAAAVRRCVECGVRCIEHGTLIDQPTADFVAEKGAFVVPTMATIFALLADGPKLGLLGSSYEKLQRVADKAVAGLSIMKRAGVRMGFGTDLLGSQYVLQGTEFTLRRQALSAADILISATSVNADIVQMKDKLGVVKAGALADLLVVDGNPLDDIGVLASNGKHLTHIMRGGEFIKRAN